MSLDRDAFPTVIALILSAPTFFWVGWFAGMLLLFVAATIAVVTWTPVRGRLGFSTATGSERIGYLGRPGSTANLKKAKFGKSLDVAIDNDRGTVDAEEAEFALDEADEKSEG